MITVEDVEKEIRKITEKKAKLLSKGRVYEALKENQKLQQLRGKLEYMVENDRTTLKELLENSDVETVEKWERNCLLMVVLIDLADSVTTEVNAQMNKFQEGMTLSTYNKVHSIKKELNDLVRNLTFNSNQETAEDWGDLSDQIMHCVMNFVYAHQAKLKRERNNKINYTGKDE